MAIVVIEALVEGIALAAFIRLGFVGRWRAVGGWLRLAKWGGLVGPVMFAGLAVVGAGDRVEFTLVAGGLLAVSLYALILADLQLRWQERHFGRTSEPTRPPRKYGN